MNGPTGKILFVSNTSWSLTNFRRGLLRSLQDDGWEVVTAAPEDDSSSRLGAEFNWIPVLHLERKGLNPGKDLLLLLELMRILRSERPDLVVSFTIKPNIYTPVAARLVGAKCICSVTGLGYTFNRRSPLSRLVTLMYRTAFRLAARVGFQNREDLALFTGGRIVPAEKAFLTPGSGVDLERFSQHDRTAGGDAPDGMRFLFAGRMLREKGVGEYAAAARAVRRKHGSAVFQLLGPLDPGNPGGIGQETIRSWEAEGSLRYMGETEDVRPFLAEADAVVFPSYYREGIPRILLEAAAMGKPIITTDSVGCREVVDQGVNGFLVPPRDAEALTETLFRFIGMGDAERSLMGERSRRKAERDFDERIVIALYKDAICDALERNRVL